MLCHLPVPYPDEFLYSDIGRYIIRVGAQNACVAADHIFGLRSKPHVDLPISLDKVSKSTWPIWHMNGEDIADQLTLFPYYTRYVPPKRAAQCLNALLSDNGLGIHSKLGLNGSRVKVPKFLRFCKVCRESDISTYGETYWHRSHQLAGVLVCPYHGDPLSDTKAPMRPRRYSDYADTTLSTSDATPDDIGLDKNDLISALKIAKRCQQMLLGPINLWPPENVNLSYRRAALERGFVEGPLFISQTKLENAFVSFYGKSLLSKLGCKVQIGTGNSWINTIFQKQKSLFHPVEHALVQIFLESVPVDTSSNPFGCGPWKCPNPYAQHKELFPISKITILGKSKEQLVASATCRCGFKFTFLQTNSEDPHLPVIKKRILCGPTWVAEAKRLKEAGLTTYSIGIKMGIAYRTVLHLLNNKSSTYKPSRKQIKKWREKWTRLLDGVPNGSRALARKKNWNLYDRLITHDREWLFAKPRNMTRTPHPQGQVNWASRDKEWSRLLKAAATEIRERTPLERVTRNAMVTQAGISTSIFAYLNRLPLCRSALRECSESGEAFRVRCVQTTRAYKLSL